MKYIKVKDEPTLVRDPTNNAILATDIGAKKRFLEDQRKKAELDSIPARIENLENDIKTIKDLLIRFINKSDEKPSIKE